MSYSTFNGGTVMAMKGKDCIAIATDMRMGFNQFSTISTSFNKVINPSSKTLIGFSGLATDIHTVSSTIKFHTNLYKLREEREIDAKALSHMIASLLYSKRFSPYLVEPIVAGLDKNNEPYLAGYDLIGCLSKCSDFAISGTADRQLFGICESFYKPDMDADQLMETISQCMLAGLDRDALSGWGCTIYLLTPTQLITKKLKSRMD